MDVIEKVCLKEERDRELVENWRRIYNRGEFLTSDGGGFFVSDRPRFLVLGDTGLAGADWLRHCGLEGDAVHAESWDAGLDRLRHQPFDAIVANPADPAVLHGLRAMVRSQAVLALHKAGRELAALSSDQLAEMSVAERIELLKLNIRRFTRDLLHYELIEIRLLDPRTGRLELLVQEGMMAQAANRVLLASSAGQGVTGHPEKNGR